MSNGVVATGAMTGATAAGAAIAQAIKASGAIERVVWFARDGQTEDDS